MDFFTNFPTVVYEVDGYSKEVANIAIGEIVIKFKTDMSYVLWKKELFDGDSPVSVSQEIYG